MNANMLTLRRTRAPGVEALKDVLEFAQKGKIQEEHTSNIKDKNQGILDHICRALTDWGFQYQRNVGQSRFKVDIAVINPYQRKEYLPGIMLDGEIYCRTRNTKDREISQLQVLKERGWALCRLWTMDWWDNRGKLQHLKTECNGAGKRTYSIIKFPS